MSDLCGIHISVFRGRGIAYLKKVIQPYHMVSQLENYYICWVFFALILGNNISRSLSGSAEGRFFMNQEISPLGSYIHLSRVYQNSTGWRMAHGFYILKKHRPFLMGC